MKTAIQNYLLILTAELTADEQVKKKNDSVVTGQYACSWSHLSYILGNINF